MPSNATAGVDTDLSSQPGDTEWLVRLNTVPVQDGSIECASDATENRGLVVATVHVPG